MARGLDVVCKNYFGSSQGDSSNWGPLQGEKESMAVMGKLHAAACFRTELCISLTCHG